MTIMRNLRKLFAPMSFVLASMVVFSSCKDDDPVTTPPPATNKTISAIVVEDAQFSTLESALIKADLSTSLNATGPFTVLSPTNDAFTKAGIKLDSLSKDALSPILMSHVLSGAIKSADFKSGKLTTGNTANDIYISKNTDGVFINGNIKVVASEVLASNGVIHSIDNVITVPNKSLIDLAKANPNFSDLVAFVTAADPSVAAALTDASANGYTVFAPTNAAFTELYKDSTTTKAILLDPTNKTLLTNVLLYHVVPNRVFSTDLPNVTGDVQTANTAGKVSFDLAGGAKVKGTKSGTSNITSANMLATNGVLHTIDKVLMP
jgi:uncharacterized surface protein with fasciclin (FAS1) repeats